MTDTPAASYDVSVDSTVEVHHPILGSTEVTFTTGPVAPRSELDELALEVLVEHGRATRTGAAPIRSTTGTPIAAERPRRSRRGTTDPAEGGVDSGPVADELGATDAAGPDPTTKPTRS